jgi:hypothetical protein
VCCAAQLALFFQGRARDSAQAIAIIVFAASIISAMALTAVHTGWLKR